MIWGTIITMGMVAVGLLCWRLLQSQDDAADVDD
jgi:hypothetical protein